MKSFFSVLDDVIDVSISADSCSFLSSSLLGIDRRQAGKIWGSLHLIGREKLADRRKEPL
jgi:hypothetical protein